MDDYRSIASIVIPLTSSLYLRFILDTAKTMLSQRYFNSSRKFVTFSPLNFDPLFLQLKEIERYSTNFNILAWKNCLIPFLKRHTSLD